MYNRYFTADDLYYTTLFNQTPVGCISVLVPDLSSSGETGIAVLR